MILPDFVIPSRVDQCWSTTGIDCEDQCLDREHYRSYPYQVEYRYNNRGYRDQSWPDSLSELSKAIWCVGDSFTVGLGSPREHTWSYILQQSIGTRTVNVSMDGASNDWISRKSIDILKQIQPKLMIIQWSYVNRREENLQTILDQHWQNFYNSIRDDSWPSCTRQNRHTLPQKIQDEIDSVHGGWNDSCMQDEWRRLRGGNCTDEEDIENILHNIYQVLESNDCNTKIIHTFIPNFVPKSFKGVVESKVKGLVIPEIKVLDLARDGHHYDILTSQSLVNQILLLL